MVKRKHTEVDRPLPIFSWAMYDFANTIYSAIVVTAFLPHFIRRLAGRDIYTGLAQTGSMILAGLVVPAAGALADRTGRAKSYLWRLTVVCCAATVAIGLVADDRLYMGKSVFASPGVLAAALLCFALANLTYQASLVFYNTLLPTVASPERQGRVSGLGVGLGYLGVVIALPIAHFAVTKTGRLGDAFIIAGLAFFVTSLPTFLFVHPPKPKRAERVTLRLVASQFRELGATLKTIARTPPVLFFFLGNFLCVDVVNTLIMWTRPYLERGAGFSPDGSIKVLMGMSVTAFLLGMGMGWLTDRLGSKRTLLAAAVSMFVCLLAAGTLRHKGALVAIILVLGSGGLAGVWVAGRKFLLEIAPADKVGEFFGFYGVTIKLSVFGCTLFAALADWVSYRAALLSLLVPLVIGIGFLAIARPQRADAVGIR
jgi:UMF1 family MFS transporter